MPDSAAAEDVDAREPVFSGYGVASAVLAVVAVAAVVLLGMIWSGHRDRVAEIEYQNRVARAAADWTEVLINVNTDNVDDSLRRLQEGTIGTLNEDFDTAIRPFTDVVRRLGANTEGQLESVAVESLQRDPRNGGPPPPKPPVPGVTRTDTVLIVATSVSKNTGDKQPDPINWRMRLDVSDAGGKLQISGLELYL
ncbi:hypothetical protein LV457_06730 [Mycobacterium sp. MYCO198283]|uniref:hypothetical protein n=1 Tax=Mycobacterium sp. MYCO198283 TaxID=2883505 RepID=UPI001E53845F|nr:hypothetical protein [Mycobacterium sp. MYCO198283]MCG5431985.1 hypothetical protein [Mycobacterium sp. MYCO198283]